MAKEKYPSEQQERFIVRLPDGMRDRIKAAAERNNRSMNAEIVARIESSFIQPPPFGGDVTAQMEAIVERVILKLQANEANKEKPKK